METTINKPEFQFTQLTAINIAKVITIVFLIALAFHQGITNYRQILYLCFHIGYCTWWLVEQWIYPSRRKIFGDPANIPTLFSIIIFVGFLYALPGYFALTNSLEISFLTIGIAFSCFLFGTLINTAADVQKLTAKEYGAGLVKDGIWRFSRNIHYFGDLLRYLSFSIISGNLISYIVPAWIALIYLSLIFKKEQSMSQKYADFEEYKTNSKRLIPFIW